MELKKMSFFSKEAIICCVCGTSFHKEEMLTGRGRLSSKEVTKELRRTYAPIPGLGIVTPLMYSITTCPECFVSFFNTDWLQINLSEKEKQDLVLRAPKRIEMIEKLFNKKLDFSKPKNQTLAAASYYLSLTSYPYISYKFSPAIKCSISAIRLSWLLDDLKTMQSVNSDYWTEVQKNLTKIIFYYLDLAYKRVLSQEEPLLFFGPDTDRNNSFEGLIYIHHYFQYQVVDKNNPILLEQTIKEIKRNLSRIFGVGKASKDKPLAILDIVRDFYNELNLKLEELTIPYDDDDTP